MYENQLEDYIMNNEIILKEIYRFVYKWVDEIKQRSEFEQEKFGVIRLSDDSISLKGTIIRDRVG